MADLTFTVDLGSCIRCAACSTVAPGVFVVSRKGSSVVRQPRDAAEASAAAAAALICPTRAIRGYDPSAEASR